MAESVYKVIELVGTSTESLRTRDAAMALPTPLIESQQLQRRRSM